MHLSIYLSIYAYRNFRTNAIVRLPHPWSGENQVLEMLLAPSTDN